jgi:hypothetical protein
MTILDRLENALARFAIPGLIRYVVALNALVFILIAMNPSYDNALVLDRTAILRGEFWRVFSWIFLPGTTSFFWIFFYLLFTWWLGDLLEQTWGTFRLNAYYFLGMFLCIASAMIFGAPGGSRFPNLFGTSGGNLFLNLSLFLAVATLAPDLEILLFFILPVKIKWVAMFSMLFPLSVLVLGPLPEKMIVAMCLGNYLVFFAPSFFRQSLDRGKVQRRRAQFESAKLPVTESLHRCETCRITEVTDPDAEFRVAADGHEYCISHLPVRGPAEGG